jgi:hypothetical protein
MMKANNFGENSIYVQRMFSVAPYYHAPQDDTKLFGILADRVRAAGASRIPGTDSGRKRNAFAQKNMPKWLAMGKGYIPNGLQGYVPLPTESKTSERTKRIDDYAKAKSDYGRKRWTYNNFRESMDALNANSGSRYAMDNALNAMQDADMKANTGDGNRSRAYRQKYYFAGGVPYDEGYLKSDEFKQRSADAMETLKESRDDAWRDMQDFKAKTPRLWTKK